MELFSFDRDYVQRLCAGDPETEKHFVRYFSDLLRIKLRNRLRSDQEVEDLQQETFLRIVKSLRREAQIESPENFGAYVYSICNYVILEHLRKKSREAQWDDDRPEPRHPQIGLEEELVSVESEQHVRTLLRELSERDRGILRAVFFDDADKDSVCIGFGVTRDYLRVLLHRAKIRFRELLADSERGQTAYPGRPRRRGLEVE